MIDDTSPVLSDLADKTRYTVYKSRFIIRSSIRYFGGPPREIRGVKRKVNTK